MANRVSAAGMQEMISRAQKLGFRPDRLALLDRRLTQWSQGGKTPALAARVLRRGQLAFEGAYGPLTPDGAPDSMRADSIFPICSMTKPATATLACIMQEEGLLDLSAPIKLYYPGFERGDPDGAIRLWHFLSHTSGLTGDEYGRYVRETLLMELPADDASGEVWEAFQREAAGRMGLTAQEDEPVGRALYRAILMSAKPTHPPQTIMRYHSFGYDLIREIIERISGQSIDEYAQEKLFGPLRMDDSHFLFPPEKRERCVRRAPGFCGANWLNEDVLPSTSGSGGLKSTAVDMTKFGQMFLDGGRGPDGRVLSKASVRAITANHNAGLPPAHHNGGIFDPAWGLGFNVGSKKDDAGMLRSPSSFEHGGYGCVKLLCDPEAEVVAALFMVSIEDNYPYSAQFNNMVLGAIGE